MKRFFVFALVLTACHSVPTVKIGRPIAGEQISATPLLSEKKLLNEEQLAVLAVKLTTDCMEGQPDTERLSTFCFCLARETVNNFRTVNPSSLEEAAANSNLIEPNLKQIEGCAHEAGDK